METSGTILRCCFPISKAPARTTNCVTEYVTYDILTAVFCIKFHASNSVHITIAKTSFDCSFRGHTKKECGVSGGQKHQTALVQLRLLQAFAGVLQKKNRTRAVFKETPTNYISTERL